jgi:hypothetical protein
MPAVSEEELEQLRSDNEKLRNQIASAETKVAENDADRQREYEATQLLAENARLEAQLASAKARSLVANSRGGAATVMDAAADQLAAAQAALENPQGVPVDVNDPDNLKKKDTGASVAVEDGKVEVAPDGTATVTAPDKPSASSSSSSGGSTSGSSTTSTNGGNS